jgi:hypothetical protein
MAVEAEFDEAVETARLSTEHDVQADRDSRLDATIAALDAYDGDMWSRDELAEAARSVTSARGKSPIPSDQQLNAMSAEQEAWFAGVPLPRPTPRPVFRRFARALPSVVTDVCRRRGTSRGLRSRVRSRPQKQRAPDPPPRPAYNLARSCGCLGVPGSGARP